MFGLAKWFFVFYVFFFSLWVFVLCSKNISYKLDYLEINLIVFFVRKMFLFEKGLIIFDLFLKEEGGGLVLEKWDSQLFTEWRFVYHMLNVFLNLLIWNHVHIQIGTARWHHSSNRNLNRKQKRVGFCVIGWRQ